MRLNSPFDDPDGPADWSSGDIGVDHDSIGGSRDPVSCETQALPARRRRLGRPPGGVGSSGASGRTPWMLREARLTNRALSSSLGVWSSAAKSPEHLICTDPGVALDMVEVDLSADDDQAR